MRTHHCRNADMRLIADLFESVRKEINVDEAFDCWDYIILDYVKFNNDICLQLLIELKESYFIYLYEKIIINLINCYKKNKEEGINLWEKIYAEAAVHFRDDLLCMLYFLRLKWEKKNNALIKYEKLPKLVREGRWPDAYPVYAEIAADENYSNEIRGLAEITLLEIVLYHYPEDSKALKHAEKAAALLPDHFMVKRAWAKYYLKTGNTQKARNSFLQVIAIKPGDYFSFNCIGDSFFTESQLENAESWYNDALQKNFMQPDSYKRLLNLYGDKTWFKDKEPQIEGLLKKIEQRQRFIGKNKLIEKKLAKDECFNDMTLYQSYRDVGAAWFANDNLEKSEEWYTKARNLQPGFASAIIDIAYLKLHAAQPKKAKQYFREALKLDRNNFETYWGLAYYYEKQHQKEKAIKAYQECFRLRPEWEDWIDNFIGNLHYTFKEYKIAGTYYRKAFELNGNYSIYKQNLADAMQGEADQLVKSSHFHEAEELYKSAVTIEDSASRWNTLGIFYYDLKRWEDAITNYKKAINLDNSNPVFYENLGLAFEKMNNDAEAEKAYKEAAKFDKETGNYFNRLGVFYYNHKDYLQSVQYYVKALDLKPDEPVYLENICLSYEQMGMQDKAEPYYLKILEKQPADDKISNMLGILYYKNKEYDKALTYYNKAIEINNKNPIYHENVGILYRDINKIREAIAAFEKALELNPKSDVTWNDTGVLYFNLEEYDKALEHYNKAIKLKSKVPLYYENIALAYERKKMFDEAVDNYKKSLQINRKNARVLNTVGLIYYNLQEYESAVEYYKKAIEVEGDNWIYQTNLGLALRLSQRYDEAIDVYRKAVELKPDDYLNLNELGVLLYQGGNTDEAIEYYKKSMSLYPNDPTLYMNLALALNAIGRTRDALNVTEGYTLTDEVKQEVEKQLQQYLPSLFEMKN